MRKSFLTIIVLLAAINTWGSNPVSIILADGIDEGTIKQKIENTLSALFTEAGAAHEAKRNLNYSKLGIADDVQSSIAMLWENSPFVCEDTEVVEHCLTTKNGYQVRNIPLDLVEADEDDRYHEAVVNFDKRGNMTGFHLAISMNLYMNVLNNDLELSDLRRRQLVLDWVEQFRTAYNQKDINFIDAVFSEDALIITGRYMERRTNDGVKLPPKVITEEKNKQEYLKSLRRVFAANKHINVTFSEIEVKMHPVDENVYGVTLHQGYSSDNYHDDGYLFLLWDFEDEDHPKIHVRAWQPDKFQGRRITDKEKIKMEDFPI